MSSDCRRQLIWRESGTAYRLENIQEKDRYPTCSIMVWAGIMINGRTRLHVVANGSMTGQRHIDEVLLPHVRLFRGAVGDKFVFMDDNATCHRTLAVQDCLDSEGIQRLVWPARSPDINPIENVWVALGRQVAGRNYPPTNKNTLIRALTEEWDKLPQQLLDNVVQSMTQLETDLVISQAKVTCQPPVEHSELQQQCESVILLENSSLNAVYEWQCYRLNYQTDQHVCSQCVWNNHESALATVIGNCSPDHDFRCRCSVSRLQTVWLQVFPWLPSDQHTAITGTKAEPAFIRKHNRSPLHHPMSSGLTPLASKPAMAWSQ
ncbi:transposable element Tcb1 transposase [Trichonephila clavipes]|nr:transposable element Tcb1 transposase [Trichonephila clavipes]